VITELPHHNMATTFYRLGLSELSDQESRAGVPANPESRTHALLNRARAALYDGRFPAASRFIGEVGSSDDPDNAWLLAEVQFYLGRRQEGERGLQAILERGSTAGVMAERARASLASLQAAGGRRSEAEATLRPLIDSPRRTTMSASGLRPPTRNSGTQPRPCGGSSEPRQPASRATRGSRRIRCSIPRASTGRSGH
jgi:hypothetical protein